MRHKVIDTEEGTPATSHAGRSAPDVAGNVAVVRDEVRAGPGDAGASDRPERLPETPPHKRRRSAAAWAMLFVLIAIGAAFYFLGIIAGPA